MSNDEGIGCLWNVLSLLFIGLCAIPGYYYFGLGGALASSVCIPIVIYLMYEIRFILYLGLIFLALIIFLILVSFFWGKFIS